MLNLQTLDDQALCTMVCSNNEHAAAELLNRYKSKFYTTIYLLTKDKDLSRDIFQDTCIKIVQCIRTGKYAHDGKFMAWGIRIARNLTIDHLRKQKRYIKVSMPDGTDIFRKINRLEKNKQDEMIIDENGRKIHMMLELLPAEQKEVVVMRIFGEMSFKEIAEANNISINTALGRMRYALLSLRKIANERGVLL